MRPAARHAPQVRTGADKKAEAIRFVWSAMDHVVRDTTAEKLALMKGVTKTSDIAEIAAALEQRKARL